MAIRWAAVFAMVIGLGCGGDEGRSAADAGAGQGDGGANGVVAVVSPDRQVLAGLVVKLDGSGSLGAASYRWQQIAGPIIELAGASEAVAWATVPAEAETASAYSFELVVEDADGQSSDRAEVSVAVKNAVFEDFTPDIDDPTVLGSSEGIAFNEQGMWVVSTQGILSLFDTGGGFVKKLTIDDTPVGANFDIEGNLIVALNAIGVAGAVDTNDGSLVPVASGLATANYPLPDKDGNLFVSNRQNQTVFRHDAAADQTVPFIEDVGVNPNSIAFGPEPDVLYVGTEGLVWRVPILPDGNAGEPVVYLDLGNDAEVDGLTFDEGRNMYVGCPATATMYVSALVCNRSPR